jgi:hypothetical protein
MNAFVTALIISLLFFTVKAIESNYSSGTPMKHVVRDSAVVYLSSVCSLYGINYHASITESPKDIEPPVFTDAPDF